MEVQLSHDRDLSPDPRSRFGFCFFTWTHFLKTRCIQQEGKLGKFMNFLFAFLFLGILTLKGPCESLLPCARRGASSTRPRWTALCPLLAFRLLFGFYFSHQTVLQFSNSVPPSGHPIMQFNSDTHYLKLANLGLP